MKTTYWHGLRVKHRWPYRRTGNHMGGYVWSLPWWGRPIVWIGSRIFRIQFLVIREPDFEEIQPTSYRQARARYLL